MSLSRVRLKRMVAMLCVALCAVLSLQFTVTAVEDGEHLFALKDGADVAAVGVLHVDTAPHHHASAAWPDDKAPDATHAHYHHGSEHQAAPAPMLGWAGRLLIASVEPYFIPEAPVRSAPLPLLERPPRPVTEHTA